MDWEVNLSKEPAEKLVAFYACYPMIGHAADPLHRATWETFSYIWDLAIESTKKK